MKNILFLMQGHSSAQEAGKFAIAMAKRLKCGVVAEYTIDRSQIFNLEQFSGEPGLCGSGAFLAAEKQIVRALVELADSMLTFFGAICEGQELHFEQFIELGRPADLLAARAQDCSMIIVPAAEANVALAKELLELASCPIVFLNGEIVLLMPKQCAGDSKQVVAALEETGRPIWVHEHIEEAELLKFVPHSSCLDDVTYSLTARSA